MRILFQNLRKFAFGTQSDSKFRGAPNQSFTYYPTTVLRRWRAPYYAIDPRIVCVDGDKSALISSSVADGSGVVWVGSDRRRRRRRDNLIPRRTNARNDVNIASIAAAGATVCKNNDDTTYAYRSPAAIERGSRSRRIYRRPGTELATRSSSFDCRVSLAAKSRSTPHTWWI